MARVDYIPHDHDKEDQKAEEKAERRALRLAPVGDTHDSDRERFGGLDPLDDEFESVEVFAEWLLDCNREEFTHLELACLNFRTHRVTALIRQDLVGYGFRLKLREKEWVFRGFKSNSHNLYEGNPMCGGSGGASIYGMAD